MTQPIPASERHALLEYFFEHAHEGLLVVDNRIRIVDANPTFCRICGYDREELLGQNPNILSSGKQGKSFYQHMWQTIEAEGYWSGEVWNRKKDGSFYAEILTVQKVMPAGSDTPYYMGMISDITTMKEHQAELERLAHHDSLTGLPNRNLLADRFELAVAHSNRARTLLGVCFLDLDNFKPVNDRYGHQVGDQLLIDLAGRLRAALRDDDTVSRIGGDEFVLLLGDVYNREDCEQLLSRMISLINQPFEINGHQIRVSASIGYTLYPYDQGSLDTLIEHADSTLYRSKLGGKNTFTFYESAPETALPPSGDFEAQLQAALDNDELRLALQPKVEMRTGTITGFEALIRWQHPQRGLLHPPAFLPQINETPLELALGEWVIKNALDILNLWQHQNQSWHLSVNLSAYHLASKGFVDELRKRVREYPGLAPSGLQLEILESHALEDLSVIAGVVSQCREELGIETVLDDFGTGYSSLSHIRTLPVTAVKIDQVFVRNMLNDPDDCKIVEGVIALARSFDLEVIAEGVESDMHGEVLLAMGCDLAQGYTIARPVLADDISQWLQQYQPVSDWLHYRNAPRNTRLAQLQLFSHYLELSFHALEVRITADRYDEQPPWPATQRARTHCGLWLERADNLEIFEPRFISLLNGLYQQYHQQLSRTLTLYRCDDIAASRQQLKDTELAFQKLQLRVKSSLSQLYDNLQKYSNPVCTLAGESLYQSRS